MDGLAIAETVLLDKVQKILDGKVQVMADPFSKTPANFEPDPKTLMAVANWVLNVWLPEMREQAPVQ